MSDNPLQLFLSHINRLPPRQRTFFIITSVLLFVWAFLGIVASIQTFSGSVRGHDGQTNWFGHSGTTIFFLMGGFMILIYFMKRLLLQSFEKWIAAWFYFWLFAVTLPYIWFLVSTSWRYQWAEPQIAWFGDPILIWFLPTVSFTIDLNRKTQLSLKWYILRTLAEFLLLPIWFYCWIIIEFFGLGWIGP